MKKSHTPGPWRVEYLQEGEDVVALIYKDNDKESPLCIADVNECPVRGEALANAMLIRATPLLLKTLQMVCASYPHLLDTKMRPQDAAAIRTAIREATKI